MTEHDSGLTDEEIAAAERLAEAYAGEPAGKIAELLLESTGQERDDTNAAPRWPPTARTTRFPCSASRAGGPST